MPTISLVGHHHTCPAHRGKCPHVGGPITSGSSACTVNGISVALVGDSCSCGCGETDTIISGSASLRVNGIPVATTGSSTAHGGVVVEGDGALHIS
jgi:uncharacterized Zn-binding protein involved in type VI secretion